MVEKRRFCFVDREREREREREPLAVGFIIELKLVVVLSEFKRKKLSRN
jgi:hypothetical protein